MGIWNLEIILGYLKQLGIIFQSGKEINFVCANGVMWNQQKSFLVGREEDMPCRGPSWCLYSLTLRFLGIFLFILFCKCSLTEYSLMGVLMLARMLAVDTWSGAFRPGQVRISISRLEQDVLIDSNIYYIDIWLSCCALHRSGWQVRSIWSFLFGNATAWN